MFYTSKELYLPKSKDKEIPFGVAQKKKITQE